jgi:hypothetical protein
MGGQGAGAIRLLLHLPLKLALQQWLPGGLLCFSRSGKFTSSRTSMDAATLHEGSKKCCVAEASPLFGYH